ncbi:transporter substrate-binding domain-containing protein [Pseudomonas coleopterorum]|uniref:Transporter substrate-binding domain-containing protein n=1 Tax=Pseudomonas coleopterorum TaxID=1605838 RepID=A0AAJ6MUA6_9PSED|nr:transporter substrate-binding domain-containing protein [Pseudomonas coleopterorum]WNC10450.1 transporter substrate-binding domain-containing protein [Pseudomonas coleopterorum]SEE65926.1 polar amino acid transport system substrate-binding protein [Pseudomonas coleopterorum]
MKQPRKRSMTGTSLGLLRTLSLATLVLSTSFGAHADLAEVKSKGFLSVATEDDYAPFNYIVDGKPEGFHKELLEDLKAYAKTQNIDVKQDILPWTGLLASVSSGQYDVAFTGALVTDERLRVFNFAPPFASAQHFYVKRADDKRLSDIASLCGKTVGVQAGSALLARLPELKKMMKDKGCEMGKVVEYPSYPEIYADLANGRLDYAVNALISVNDLVKTRGDTFAKGIAVSGAGFAAWPVPKNSPELLTFLSGFMDQIRANGRLAALQTKWFGEAFPDMPKEPITNVEQFHTLAGMK